MSTITPHYRTVQQLLQSQSFSIDEYQREYKWGKENVDRLLIDLREKFLRSYREGDATTRVANYDDYYLGSIIVSKRNGRSYLIDGQQRVTSLTLLLIYLYRRAKEAGLPLAERLAPLIFSDNFGEPQFNLDIPDRLDVLRALFRGDPFDPEGKEESVQTMFARYNDIREMDLVGELGPAFPHFLYWLLARVGLIEIATDNDNAAYAIFETMNDRGVPLSQVDMLKAYLLSAVEATDRRRQANDVWKKEVLALITAGAEPDASRDQKCIQAWFRAQYADTIRERRAGASDQDWELAGSVFHRWAREHASKLHIGQEEQNLRFMTREFPFYANAYRQIIGASETYTPGLEPVYYNADNDFTWQNTVLLAALTPDDDAETVRRKLGATATYLDIWIMRRIVNYVRVGYSATNYAMWLLAKEIRRKPIAELVSILRGKLDQDEVTFEAYPTSDRRGLDEFRLNQFTKRYIRHMLARVTSFVEVESGKPDLFASYADTQQANPWDIEHIWPDDYPRFSSSFRTREEFSMTRNSFAALLLLPADVNRSYSDRPFAEKVPHYARQNLYAASLSPATYAHQPRFLEFIRRRSVPLQGYSEFRVEEQAQRHVAMKRLVHLVWSPARLEEYLP